MINVVKNRARLCALTTSALFFLQGADVSVAGYWFSSLGSSLESLFSSSSKSEGGSKPSKSEGGSKPSESEGSSEPRAEAQKGGGHSGDLTGGSASRGDSVPERREEAGRTGSQAEHQAGGALSGGSPKEPNVLKSQYKCDPKNYNVTQDPVYCSDDKTHTMKMAVVNVKKVDDNAVFAQGTKSNPDNAQLQRNLIAANGTTLELNKGTALELSDVLLRGKANPSVSQRGMLNIFDGAVGNVPSFIGGVGKAAIAVDESTLGVSGLINGVGWAVTANRPGFGSGVFATGGAKVTLKDSSIQDFIVGLEATDGSLIEMIRGDIRRVNVGALADLKSFIYLLETNINVETNKIPLGTIGLQSFGSSGVVMRGGSITFEKGGVGVWAEDNGTVRLENVKIKIAEKGNNKGSAGGGESRELKSELEPSSTIFLVRDGFVSAYNTNFDGSDVVALLVNGHLGGVINKKSPVTDSSSQIADGVLSSVSSRLSAHIKSANIKVDGGGSYGVYFQNELQVGTAGAGKDITIPESLKKEEKPWHVVLLDTSTLRVPDGVAIYSKGLRASVVVKDESVLSGGLLLNSKNGSDLSVVVDQSEIKGAARVDKNSHAKLFLSRGSTWSVTENPYAGNRFKSSGEYCVDSCISSMNLANSSIIFFTSNSDNAIKYRTLLIGNKQNRESAKDTVYTAFGDSRIYFNVNLAAEDAENVQVSDRLLIDGNVEGKTVVYVYNTGTIQSSDPNPRRAKSFPLIQIFGQAESDSFSLEGGYITLGDTPYQYILSPYKYILRSGLSNDDQAALKLNRFNKNLLTEVRKGFWEFRLEEKREQTIVTAPSTSGVVSIITLGGDSESDDGYDMVDSSISETEELPVVGTPDSSVPLLPPQTDSLLRSEPVEEPTGISSGDLSEPRASVLTVQSSASTVNAETGSGIDEEQIGGREDSSEPVTLPVPTSSEGSTSEVPVRSDSVVRSEPSEDSTPTFIAPPVLSSGSPAAELGRSETSGDIVRNSSSSNSLPRELAPLSSAASGDDNAISTLVESAISIQPESSTREKPVVSAEKNTVSISVNPATSAQPEVPAKPATSSGGAVGRVLPIIGAEKGNVSTVCDGTENGGVGRSQTAYSCNDGQTHTVKGLTLKASDATQHLMRAGSHNTVINLEGAIITGAVDRASNVDITKTLLVSTVLAENGAEVVLDKKSTVKNSSIGLEAQKGGKVKMNDGTVNASYVGALAGSGSSVNLSNTKIHVTGDSAIAGVASNAGEIIMNSGAITLTNGVAVRSESGGRIKLDRVDITAKKGQNRLDETFGRSVFLVTNNASVEFTNGNVTTDATALWVKGSNDAVEARTSRRRKSADVRPSLNNANIEFSTVKVEGDGAYGMYFDGAGQKRNHQQNAVSQQEKTPIHVTGAISLKKTNFEVANGIAVYANNSNGQISLEKETILAGGLLLSAENNSSILASVDNSAVVGGTRVEKGSYAQLDLSNKSAWILKRSARKIATSDSGCVDSCVSSVSLVNSRINFVTPKSEEKYQTLRIGEGNGIVYRAEGDASIHLNAHLSPNNPSGEQVTDRLVIHGDVSGRTTVHVQGVSEDIANKGYAKNPHSVSIIQVYGTAAKDSFQLDGKYVALHNSPYKYTLRSYGPEATEKQEHVEQKFIKDGGKFWNFRLENQYVKSTVSMVGSALPEQLVRSVVPQVPTYLLLPNSIFHAGLMDINNQGKQLETLRATYNGMVEVRENPALYLRGYGGSYHYTPDLSALEYGYKGNLNYNGVEAGILLQTIENTDSALSFGVLGSYGKLSLQPVDVEQSQESAFDKWTATAYGSMQHDAGFYVDGLLSYGLLKGDVLTLARGKTATLKGNPLSVSLTGGQTIATGYEGFVVDPQVQVVYQHLQFEKARDIDNFDIEMGKLDQWIARVGGRLIKTPRGSEGVNNVSFYSKLYLVHGFEGKKSVHFKDAFQLGAFGSSLEAGLGFNAKLSSAFSLHGDIVYQHKLNKAGFSGTSFSGGVRYQF